MDYEYSSMVVFGISDDNFIIIKRNFMALMLSATIIGFVLGIITILYTVNNSNIRIISIVIYSVSVFILLPIIIKKSLKSIEKDAKSLFYVFEDEHFIIKKNDTKIIGITKNEIKCINKYNNNMIILVLINNKKIILNKYMENIEGIINEFKNMSVINEMDKNPYLVFNVLGGIIGLFVFAGLFFSKNLLIATICGVILFSFCVYIFILNIKNKSNEPKKKIWLYLLLPVVLALIVFEILEILKIL